MKNQLLSLFQFYSCIDGSLHVSGPQAHLQENSHRSSHNHWFSVCTALVACSVCLTLRRLMSYIYIWSTHSWCFYITHDDAPQSVGLLWTSDQVVAETSTWQHTTLTTALAVCSVCSEHTARAVQTLNQWLCEQLCELSWGWACGPETCRDPAIYK